MAKLIPIVFNDGAVRGYRFYCPACKELHPFYVSGPPPLWSFDGNMDSPSFSPSLRMLGGNGCHLYVGAGSITYCNDSGHELKGQTIPMVEWDLERWCPVGTLHTINGKPVGGEDNSQFRTANQAPPPMVGVKPAPTPEPTASAAVEKTVAAPAKSSGQHRAECGDVGDVGDVGDLGSNAK